MTDAPAWWVQRTDNVAEKDRRIMELIGANASLAIRVIAADALADAVTEWMKEGPPPAEAWARMENALDAYREASK